MSTIHGRLREAERDCSNLARENAALEEQVAQLEDRVKELIHTCDRHLENNEKIKYRHQIELTTLQSKADALVDALEEVSNWLVCSPIATAEDMAQSFPYMYSVCDTAITTYKGARNDK